MKNQSIDYQVPATVSDSMKLAKSKPEVSTISLKSWKRTSHTGYENNIFLVT